MDSPEVCEIDSSNSSDSESLADRFTGVNISSSTSTDSDDSSPATKDFMALSQADSDESEDTEAIRARARQIIMAARGKGAWGGDDSDSDGEEEEDDDDDYDNGTSIQSNSLSWDGQKLAISSDSTEESIVQERAESILKRARMNLQAEEECSDFPPKSILSPRVGTKESVSFDVSPGMGSLEAATVIQSVARMFLAKKLVLGMMFSESKEYQDDDEILMSRGSEDYEQDEEAVEEPMVHAKFEPLGVNNPTVGSEDWSVEHTDDAHERDSEDPPEDSEDPPEDIQEEEEVVYVAGDAQEEVEELVVQDNEPQAESPEIVPDEVDFDAQDDTDPSTAKKDDVGQEPDAAEEALEDAVIPQQGRPQPLQALQQHEVHMSDYSAVLGNQPVITPPNIDAPSRGIFASLACKFDDAVSDAIGRVHSIVNCSTTGENNAHEGGFGEAYEAEQNSLIASPTHGQVKIVATPCQAKYETQMMMLAMRGWTVSNAPCSGCNKNFMMSPQDGQMICAGCDTVQAEPHPQPAALPSHPAQAVNVAPRSQAPIAHQAPPHPASFANHAPLYPQTAVSHAVPSQLYMTEMNRRVQMGWVAMNRGCPYCCFQLMRKPNDDTDHCLACGPIFSQPVQSAVMTPSSVVMAPSMPNVASYTSSYTPIGGNQINASPLRDVTAVHYGATAAPPMPTAMQRLPRPLNPANPAPKASSSAPPPPPPVQSAYTPTMHGVIAPNVQQMVMTQKWSQDDEAKENASGDANVSRQLEDAKLRILDAKKFIMSRRPPTAMPPSANNMIPGASPFRQQISMPHPQMMSTPQMQQMSMMTPGSHAGNFHPMMNSTPASQVGVPTMPMPQMNVIAQASPFHSRMNVMTPGSAQYRNQLQTKGSLMSPENETSVGQTSRVDAESTASAQPDDSGSPETNDSGYRTPQMPGKYFFA